MAVARSFRVLLTATAALGFLLLVRAGANAQVGVSIDGAPVNIAPPPIIQAGRVFVPLRGVFERLGASVVYDNGQINATGNGNEISLHIGSNQATINGSPQQLDVAPFIVGSSTYVPLRFVSESLGANVQWDEANHIVAITTSGGQAAQSQAPPQDDQSYADATDWVSEAPPELPVYEPPPAPQQNYIWIPGYWAWSNAGYFWVPGTWVPAPQPGLLWTPGYWGWQNGYYGWHPGYWAQSVGFYGGIYYGAGYYGNGYVGGRWYGNSFRYNTAVVPVAPAIVNVYVDRTVIVNRPATRTAYQGGPGGLRAQPTAAQIAVTHTRHLAMTTVQQQHVQTASQDRRFLATVNAGKPSIITEAKPLAPDRKPTGFVPLTTQDKTAGQKFVVQPVRALRAPATLAPRAPAIATPIPAERRIETRAPEATRPPEATRTPEATRPPEIERRIEATPRPTPVPTPVRAATPLPTPVRIATPLPTPVRTAPPQGLARPATGETQRPRVPPTTKPMRPHPTPKPKPTPPPPG